MPTIASRPLRNSQVGRPAWELVEQLPTQGNWRESDYLALDAVMENQRRVELVNGYLEFLPMPTRLHERIVKYLFMALLEFNRSQGLGEVFFSGRKTRLWEREIRLPDIVFIFSEHESRDSEDCCEGADLVMEVVSKGTEDRRRDLVEKRADYAKARISEYWIIDSLLKQIRVLTLNGGKTYKVHGEFKKGQTATSKLLNGFEVNVAEALAGLKQ
ncbi:MAG: Uma2 family endonuclease [Planctomycetota bacterium]